MVGSGPNRCGRAKSDMLPIVPDGQIPDSDSKATTRLHDMVDQMRRTGGAIGNSPNNLPANLWNQRSARPPSGDLVKPDPGATAGPKRGLSPNPVDSQPNSRARHEPAQAVRSQASTTVDEDQLDELTPAQVRPESEPASLEVFLIRCGIQPDDRHTREILSQHRITQPKHFGLSDESELQALGLTVGASRALCQGGHPTRPT
ncbi:uncharacterized protein PGTG_21400 [Puccinia graminis f. sp. tritici CRL 75-36-700-3]|uniref:Uncharacterized protein n=1 Tax=Puccinia graminis f. sp. tritici (strain CRL 75-36-700-3 / race SCCL) TaxID=418459 RepID=H6QR78_PUCGT|nr:uncharacterized protein PGTG_21400 [Puccinia graminis f. sp. tritici CRL 75-36-700-3]EHS63060.1 hypothetical protein PGTG_21400 [Puccinia graminis f. sp. tritici CRL 75-36-700-3]